MGEGVREVRVPYLLPFAFDSTVLELGLGEDFVVVRTRGGHLYGWGNNMQGQLGLPTSDQEIISSPVSLDFLGTLAMKMIACTLHSVATITEGGQLIRWGLLFGSLNDPEEVRPRMVSSPEKFTLVRSSPYHIVCLSEERFLFFLGNNHGGIPTEATEVRELWKYTCKDEVTSFAVGANYTAFITRGHIQDAKDSDSLNSLNLHSATLKNLNTTF